MSPHTTREQKIRAALEQVLADEARYIAAERAWTAARKAYHAASDARNAAHAAAIKAIGTGEGVILHHGYAWHMVRNELKHEPIRQDVSTQVPLLPDESAA